jgi:hypothetical protein
LEEETGTPLPPVPLPAGRAEPIRRLDSEGLASAHLDLRKEGDRTMEATRESMSPSDDTMRCQQCGAGFPTWEALSRHQSLVHPSDTTPEFEPGPKETPGAPESPSVSEGRPDEAEMSDQQSRRPTPAPQSPWPSRENSDRREPDPSEPRNPRIDPPGAGHEG